MTDQRPRRPRDVEEAAAFKGMGRAIAANRERCRMDREELAAKSEMTSAELEAIERGEVDESWSGIGLIAEALGMAPAALMDEAEEATARYGAEVGPEDTRVVECDSSTSETGSDATGMRRA